MYNRCSLEVGLPHEGLPSASVTPASLVCCGPPRQQKPIALSNVSSSLSPSSPGELRATAACSLSSPPRAVCTVWCTAKPCGRRARHPPHLLVAPSQPLRLVLVSTTTSHGAFLFSLPLPCASFGFGEHGAVLRPSGGRLPDGNNLHLHARIRHICRVSNIHAQAPAATRQV